MHLNLPAELIALYDAQVEALNAQNSGPTWTRTALIKDALAKVAKTWGEESESP